MKLTMDFDSMIADHDWGTTVGEVIRDEIKSAIQRMIRTAIREQKAEINNAITRQVKAALKGLNDERLAALMGEYGSVWGIKAGS